MLELRRSTKKKKSKILQFHCKNSIRFHCTKLKCFYRTHKYQCSELKVLGGGGGGGGGCIVPIVETGNMIYVLRCHNDIYCLTVSFFKCNVYVMIFGKT